MIELAHRESGSTHIALLWSKERATLTVSIVGSSPDDSFELEAAEATALDELGTRITLSRFRKASPGVAGREGMETTSGAR